jgi:hypothetical protein
MLTTSFNKLHQASACPGCEEFMSLVRGKVYLLEA